MLFNTYRTLFSSKLAFCVNAITSISRVTCESALKLLFPYFNIEKFCILRIVAFISVVVKCICLNCTHITTCVIMDTLFLIGFFYKD